MHLDVANCCRGSGAVLEGVIWRLVCWKALPLLGYNINLNRYLAALTLDMNATWVCAAAKAGDEEGVYQIGGSCIIAPTGEIVAQVRLFLPGVLVLRCSAMVAISRRKSTFCYVSFVQTTAARILAGDD